MGEWQQSQGRRNDHFRTGETLLVKSAEESVTVVLNDGTATKDDKGLFGLDKKQLSGVVLIPRLKVDVHQTSDGQGRVMHA
jgi:hypothetical protein